MRRRRTEHWSLTVRDVLASALRGSFVLSIRHTVRRAHHHPAGGRPQTASRVPAWTTGGSTASASGSVTESDAGTPVVVSNPLDSRTCPFDTPTTMLELLKRRLRAMGAEDESDTDYDGFLSYSDETHAVGHGLYHGLRTRRLTAGDELPDNEDVQSEPHYYKGAFVAGTILQWVGGGAGAYGLSTLL